MWFLFLRTKSFHRSLMLIHYWKSDIWGKFSDSWKQVKQIDMSWTISIEDIPFMSPPSSFSPPKLTNKTSCFCPLMALPTKTQTKLYVSALSLLLPQNHKQNIMSPPSPPPPTTIQTIKCKIIISNLVCHSVTFWQLNQTMHTTKKTAVLETANIFHSILFKFYNQQGFNLWK